MHRCVGVLVAVLMLGTSFTLSAARTQVVQPPVKPPAPGAADVKQPRKLVNVDPIYPEEMRRQCVGGDVRLEAIIDKDGTIKEVRSVNGPAGLHDAATTAVKQWRYEPVMLSGVAVPVVMRVTVTFGAFPCLKVLPAALAELSGTAAGATGKPSAADAHRSAVRAWMATSGSEGVPLSGPVLSYPPIAQAARIQGLVIVDCVIGADGKPGEITVVRPAPLLDQATIEAIRASTFPSAPTPRVVRIAADFSFGPPR